MRSTRWVGGGRPCSSACACAAALCLCVCQIADVQGTSTWAIVTTETLALLAKRIPCNTTQLAQIPSIGKTKAEKFAQSFLPIIWDTIVEQGVKLPPTHVVPNATWEVRAGTRAEETETTAGAADLSWLVLNNFSLLHLVFVVSLSSEVQEDPTRLVGPRCWCRLACHHRWRPVRRCPSAAPQPAGRCARRECVATGWVQPARTLLDQEVIPHHLAALQANAHANQRADDTARGHLTRARHTCTRALNQRDRTVLFRFDRIGSEARARA